MKLYSITISLVAATAIYAAPITLQKIDVDSVGGGGPSPFLINDANSSVSPSIQNFSSKSVSALSSTAKTNPYFAIQFAPSVNYSPVDISGSNESSHHAPIRIRGEFPTGPGGVYGINGIPLSSNPGGGKQMLDMENVASIKLYKGYMPVEENLGLSTLVGRIDMQVLAPAKKQKTVISQSFGSFNFQRTFVRFDTGKIGDFSFFGSLSQMSDKQTKGPGGLHRINGMIGMQYKPSSKFKAQLYAIRNSERQNDYRQLSFDQATNLDKYFGLAFTDSKSDNLYYDWNKESYQTNEIFAILDYKPTEKDKIVFKPYYKQDTGYYMYANPKMSNMVMDWRMNHDLYGAIASYQHAFSKGLKVKVGYWYDRQRPPGPPTNIKMYKINNGTLNYAKTVVAARADYYTMQTPFLQLSGDLGKFHYKAGVSYQSIKIGSIQTADANSSVNSKSLNNVSPSLYLGYDVTHMTTIYADYTRKYGFNVNLAPVYMMANPKPSVPLQTFWNNLKVETSDNIELGVKTNIGAITVKPDIYTSFYKNKQASVYDSTYGWSYPANVGDALAYGAELSAYGPITENLQFLAGFSYNRYKFTQNFATQSGTTDIKGNQLPDAPKYLANAALIYNYDRWSVTPSVRYTSSRYGDVANTQKLDAYTLVNLNVGYKAHPFMGSKSTLFSLTAMNLTDEKYIASVITADNIVAASTTSSTYMTGAPFSLYASITLKY